MNELLLLFLVALLGFIFGITLSCAIRYATTKEMSNLVVQDDPDNPNQPYIFLELSTKDMIALQAHDPETVIFKVKYNKYRKNSKD